MSHFHRKQIKPKTEQKQQDKLCLRCFIPFTTSSQYQTRCDVCADAQELMISIKPNDLKSFSQILSDHKYKFWQQVIAKVTYTKDTNENGHVTKDSVRYFYPLPRIFTQKDICFDNTLELDDLRVCRAFKKENSEHRHTVQEVKVIRVNDMVTVE